MDPASAGSKTGESDRCVRIAALCAEIWALRPTARCFAYLRVRSSGRTRELILGAESFVAGAVALLDWERAPLAEVFLAHEIGDEYDLDLDERRSVEGVVLDRAILRTARDPQAGASVIEIDDGEQCRVRTPSGWAPAPTRLRSPMSLREPAVRGRASSPIEVELDAVQRRGVSLDPDRSLLILGEAGFGKTTVALHRIARLREQAGADGRSFRALVLVPTRGLQRLIVALLDRLGVRDVEVRSFNRWIAEQGRQVFGDLPERDSETAPLAVSRVKRHPALREVLPEIVRGTAGMREVEAGYRDDETVRTAEQLLHLFGDRALLERVAARSAGALGPRMLDQVLAHTKVQFSPTTEHAHADVDADRLRTVDGSAIDAGTPQHDAETIDPEDFAVLFELDHLRGGARSRSRTRYAHIVVDEAQEFAAIELAVIGRARAPGGSITVAGDEHQQVDETIAFTSWAEVLTELGIAAAPGGSGCEQIVLEVSYRCPPVVEALARSLFEVLPDVAIASGDPALSLGAAAHELELISALIRTLIELRQHDRLASVAVVCRFAASARRTYALLVKAIDCRLVVDGDFRFGPGISVTCVDEIKGLEFDYVIVPDASAANYPDTREARRALYVAVTRATARLWLAWTGRASPLLDAGQAGVHG